MANSELYDKTYRIPDEIINKINSALVLYPNVEGIKRAKNLVNNKQITYQSLKRLKNFFDYFNKETDSKEQYILCGGDLMRSFIESTLNSDRSAVERGDEITREIQSNPNSELKPTNLANLNESTDVAKNVTIIIVNGDNKFLLLKRADVSEIWMPNKWALAGGRIEKGESPEKAIKREVLEETGLEIESIIKAFSIIRDNNIEHLYACRYEGDPTDVKLNKEHVKYGWYGVDEVTYLDTVPHLIEFLTMTFKNYDDSEE
jgi:8-oxo-dGTP diphosphatase